MSAHPSSAKRSADCAHNFLGESACEHCGAYESTVLRAEIERLLKSEAEWREALHLLCVRVCGEERTNRGRWVADIEGTVTELRSVLGNAQAVIDRLTPIVTAACDYRNLRNGPAIVALTDALKKGGF